MEIKYSVYSSSCVRVFTARLLGNFENQSLKMVKRFYFNSQAVSFQAIFESECNLP